MNDELTNIDISEQLENDNDEFSVVVKNRKDILNDIGFDNIEDVLHDESSQPTINEWRRTHNQ